MSINDSALAVWSLACWNQECIRCPGG